MADANEFSQQIDFMNGGPLEKTWGPYATKEEACFAIEDMIDSEGKNLRMGKVVAIGADDTYILYWWKGGYTNEHLVEYTGDKVGKVEVPSNISYAIVDSHGWAINIIFTDLSLFSVEPVQSKINFDALDSTLKPLIPFDDKSPVTAISSTDPFGWSTHIIFRDGSTYDSTKEPTVSVTTPVNGISIGVIDRNSWSDYFIFSDGSAWPGVTFVASAENTVTKTDSYNLSKSLALDLDLIRTNESKTQPYKIPLGSFSWWCKPHIITVLQTDAPDLLKSNYTYVAFTAHGGDQVVTQAQDYRSANRRWMKHRCVSPEQRYPCDEHNSPSINVTGNQKFISAVAGHYDEAKVYVKIMDKFDAPAKEIELITNGKNSYVQNPIDGANVLIFTRDAGFRWSYFFSRDHAVNWSSCLPFLQGDPGHRAYMATQKAEGHFLKIYWYPSADERANTFVRYVEVNMETGDVLTKAGGALLGNIYTGLTPIDMYTGGTLLYTNAGIPDDISGGNRRIRLLDVSGNSREEAVFLVATLTGEPSTPNANGDYRLITVNLVTMERTSIILTDYGKEFFNSVSDYMGGAYFEQSIKGKRTGVIYLSKFGTENTVYNPESLNNKFRIEKWKDNVFSSLIEESDTQLFRPAPPQFFGGDEPTGIQVAYMKGDYFSFNDFYSDIILKN